MVPKIGPRDTAGGSPRATLATDPVRDENGNAFVAEFDTETGKITFLRNGQELSRDGGWSVASHNIRFPKGLDPYDPASPISMHIAIGLRDGLKRRIPYGYRPTSYVGE